MKPRTALLAALLLPGLLSACSAGGEPIDPTAVEAMLTTRPETVEAGSAVELRATFTGMEMPDDATVTYDVRLGDKPQLFDAAYEGDGVFAGTFTFPDKGTQTLYIHLYAGDLHLTKKKTVEVR